MRSRARLSLISASAATANPDGAGGSLSLTPLGSDEEFRATLETAKAGDRAALAALYRLVHPRVSRYVWVICPPAAEQLASETWLELVQGLPFFDGDQAAVQARALTIAYQRARERPRRRVLRRRRAEPGSGRPDALAAVGGLPRPWAEVLLLRVLGGMSVEEVAVVTDRSVRSVRILQHLALRSLARRATRDGGPA